MGARAVCVAMVCMLGCVSVRPIDDGKAFRATGLTSRSFKQAVEENGVRTVVNLSGFDPAADWYRDQTQVCRENQVRQVDLLIDPDGPGREEIARLLETFKAEDKPILLHANHPWHGVGLASGVYRLTEMDGDKQAARKELPFWSWRRWPVRRLQNHDEFLYDWRNEDEFFATYQLDTPRRRRIRRQETESARDAPSVSLGTPF